jgi:hypothetical protein
MGVKHDPFIEGKKKLASVNKALKILFKRKWDDEVNGQLKLLHSEELRSLYIPPSIVMIVK